MRLGWDESGGGASCANLFTSNPADLQMPIYLLREAEACAPARKTYLFCGITACSMKKVTVDRKGVGDAAPWYRREDSYAKVRTTSSPR